MEHLIDLFVTPGKCKQLKALGLLRHEGPIYRTLNFESDLPIAMLCLTKELAWTVLRDSEAISYSDITAWTVMDMLMLIPDWLVSNVQKSYAIASDAQYRVEASRGLFLPDVAANHVISYLVQGKLSVEECNKKFSSLKTNI